MKWMHMVTWILIIVGALNWGLVGIGGFFGTNLNVVNLILGFSPALEWVVYVLVGLSAVYEVFVHRKNCRQCNASGSVSM
jgi:uncharacterized membrane protein YuzA (DUF378 family)